MKIGSSNLDDGQPVYVIAEIGINHNGDLDIARGLMDVAASAGCQAVKFQKRDPEVSTPEAQKSVLRETPWGQMTYLEYKYRVEFERAEYDAIDVHAKKIGIDWFASPWDLPSVEFLASYNLPAMKIASATLTDSDVVRGVAEIGIPAILSTGMSSLEEIDQAVNLFSEDSPLALLHCTSTYPLTAEEANLKAMVALGERYNRPVGYSGHETGLQISIAAVALGARIIERHITLDRAMWGTDQSASLEPRGLQTLVRDIRVVEVALGDGIKKVYESELTVRDKLRR
jgi:N-acetylneuraminate synthase